jgi:branched-chain amino acid transport system ATP-binding protein
VLEIEGLRAGYGAIEILRGVDLAVGAGEIVTLLGSNGAGKSTLNNNVSGLYRPFGGAIRFEGEAITGVSSMGIVERGLIQVPEGRRVFPNLSVRENLELGSYRRGRARRARNLERVNTIFPRLRERFGQAAGTLSGGEQQMLAIGRALMSRPRLIMFDEPSLGLSPALVGEMFRIIERLNREDGLTIILVEQNVAASLQLAERAYVLETGRIVMSGSGADLLNDDRVRVAYLGL